MMNDLLKLKEELEMARKYVPLVGFKEEDIATASKSEARTLLEYAAMENTDEFVVLCENLIKEAVVLFGKNNIPCDLLTLSTAFGFLCTPELIEFLKDKYTELSSDNPEICCSKIIFNNIGTNVSLKYIPMRFSVNLAASGICDANSKKFLNLNDYLKKEYIPPIKKMSEIDELCQKSIFAVVDIEKFLKKMLELGYYVNFANYDFVIKLPDYIKALNETSFTTDIRVLADFRTAELKRKKELKRENLE